VGDVRAEQRLNVFEKEVRADAKHVGDRDRREQIGGDRVSSSQVHRVTVPR
jgi:hypothetical protein